MEKFEITDEKSLEIFGNFVSKAKDAFTTLIDNIKENIKRYEQSIEDTEKEISDTESSKEKCEHEITKMEGKIATIKDAIENVESTYKKMVDAYSQTSKGETKDIYSDIISGAKANCEKDVEKNRSEIARLNSDIEAIKNNIQEFDRIIDTLNKTLENNNLELSKYNKALAIMEKSNDKLSLDLDDIANATEKPKTKKKEVVKEVVKEEKKSSVEEKKEKPIKEEKVLEEVKEEPQVLQELDPIFSVTPEVADLDNENNTQEVKEDDSLQRIYDLTGYKPKKDEEEKTEDKPAYNENLENLFLNSNEEVKPSEEIGSYNADNMSEWESILNDRTNIFDSMDSLSNEQNVVEPVVKKTIQENMNDTVDQLLKPYGTDFDKLKSLVGNKIEHLDGTSTPFELTIEDVIKVVNDIDGNDIKSMKVVGPETTLLKKIKNMKEGK